MLEEEFTYYKEHQGEIVKEHLGKYVVVVKKSIVGSYDTELEAYRAASKEYEPGTFLIQYVTKDDSAYTQAYHSRVAL